MSTIGRFQNRLRALPTHPRLRPGYRLVEEQVGQYLLLSATNSFKVALPFPNIGLPEFLDRLDGQRSLTSLLEPLPPFHINFLLDVVERLYQADLLIAASQNGHHARYGKSAELFDQLRQVMPTREQTIRFLSAGDWQKRLAKSSVGVVGLGRVGSQLARQLAVAGVGRIVAVDERTVDDGLRYTDAWYCPTERGTRRATTLKQKLHTLNPDCQFDALDVALDDLEGGQFPAAFNDLNLIVVATDAPRQQLYEQVNLFCVQAGLAWSSYRPDWTGLVVEVGPTVLPKETACYTCYQHRWRSNLARLEQDEALLTSLQKQKLPLLELQITPCVSLLCYEVLRFLSAEIQPYTLGAVLHFDVGSAELSRHPLLKDPQCPTCRRNIYPFAPARFWTEIEDAVASPAEHAVERVPA